MFDSDFNFTDQNRGKSTLKTSVNPCEFSDKNCKFLFTHPLLGAGSFSVDMTAFDGGRFDVLSFPEGVGGDGGTEMFFDLEDNGQGNFAQGQGAQG